MKDKSVAFIACRVLALYIAIRNAGSVASYIPFLLTSKAELWIQPIA